jgi:hypothetical protein
MWSGLPRAGHPGRGDVTSCLIHGPILRGAIELGEVLTLADEAPDVRSVCNLMKSRSQACPPRGIPRKLAKRPYPTRSGGGRENLNHFCIALTKESWQELLEPLQSHAVPREVGSFPRWGAHGTGTSVHFRDRGSNLIEAKCHEEGQQA